MTSPWPAPEPNPLPTGPRADDPTGLRYDRSDYDEPTTAATLREAGGWAVTGRGPYAMQLKACCGIGAGEVCDCAEFAGQLSSAPVMVMGPFDLRALAAQGITAAEQDRRERGAA